ncbi:MAG: hypothetical protein UV10_C0036G0002 [Candidatus Azambacteria bacterium GW2011_GWA1_42_19]|uniref:Uncharacterized protein n=1 Tax=Candidatus Azambacteria bacterium GW2011_GWA1_42_19 TaxID=1618609 RepID=A0A0G1C5T2_9BACT|nr:MAG: hypothetical protein UV10_C0036G0002 [Candidatus Azambacteria bacterium GW2011_GWA1_42_19]
MIIIEQLRNLLILGILLVVGVTVSMVYKSNNPICPDDFKDPKREIAAFSEWGKEFWENNPNATVSDFSQARVDFWRENNCTKALKRYEDYMAGNVDEETKQLIEMVIKEEVIKNQRTPVCPDEYENQEDYIKAVGEWLGDFYDKNPNITKDEMLSARKNFLFENGCKELSI